MSQTRTKVGLVVDRNFGPRVARLARAFHVWTVDSPGNTPYIREFWRGPNRDGISQETGFKKEWPKDGPALLWRASEIGRGYSTPAVAGDRLYLMGSEGNDNEFVEAPPGNA